MKYFVGRYSSREGYRCRSVDYFWDPLHFSPKEGEVIWRGDDLAEGRQVAKQANEKRKAARLRKKAPLLVQE